MWLSFNVIRTLHYNTLIMYFLSDRADRSKIKNKYSKYRIYRNNYLIKDPKS